MFDSFILECICYIFYLVQNSHLMLHACLMGMYSRTYCICLCGLKELVCTIQRSTTYVEKNVEIITVTLYTYVGRNVYLCTFPKK